MRENNAAPTRRREYAAALPDQEDQGDAEDGGHNRDPQQWRDLVIEQVVSGEPEQGPHHRAEGVHRPVEGEHPATGGDVDIDHQERVARRTSQPLAEPVDHPSGQHAGPGARGGDDHLAESRNPVAGCDERLAREPVPERSRGQLRQRRGALGGTFDGTDHRDRRAQHRGEVDGQQRVEQFTGAVLQKRHRRQHPDVAGEPAVWLGGGGHQVMTPDGSSGFSSLSARGSP